MKFSLISAALLCFSACVSAIPINFEEVDGLVERSYEMDDELAIREWQRIEARTGAMQKLETSGRKQAHAFIDSARHGGQLGTAAAAGSSAKTAKSDKTFHLDRQQPSNSAGTHKVALQLNQVKKNHPSTVGQVAIHGNHKPSDARVAKALKHSVTTGKETHINHPNSKKAQNIAKNNAAHAAKQQRVANNHKAGTQRAAKGEFKKGRK